MPSISGPKADLAKFAERLRVIAEELKRLPGDASSLARRKDLSKEITEIAVRLLPIKR